MIIINDNNFCSIFTSDNIVIIIITHSEVFHVLHVPDVLLHHFFFKAEQENPEDPQERDDDEYDDVEDHKRIHLPVCIIYANHRKC